MSKHTSGPWHVRNDGARNLWIESPEREREICDLNPYAPNDEPTEEDWANGRLIAAAPDLATAAEAVLADVTWPGGANVQVSGALMDWLQRVVRRARGEEER